MKKLTFIFLSLLISEYAFPVVDTLQSKSKITDATIFFSGAQITRHIDLKVLKGKHVVMVDKLPQELNTQSIQVNGIVNCKILSVKHQLIYQNENKKSAEETEMESRIDSQELKIKEIKNRLTVFDLEEKLLLDNSMLSKKDDGSTVTKIKEAADFYRVRINEIRQGKLILGTELKSCNKKIQEYYVQLNELTVKKRKTYSQVLITIDAEKETAADLKMSYYISSAGWEPLYDFRVDDISEPLTIVYNANVYQSSGEDWNNVNIKLSTSNPSLSGDKPELSNWYLGRKNQSQTVAIRTGASALKGTVLDEEKNEGLPFANVVVYKGDEVVSGTTTDLDGQYMIKPIPSGKYNIKVSYIGFDPMQVNNVPLLPDKATLQDFKLKANKIELSEVAVINYNAPVVDKSKSTKTVTYDEIQSAAQRDINSISSLSAGVFRFDDDQNVRGSRSDGSAYYVDGIKSRGIETTNYISNSLKTLITNLEYAIEIPYTIPSDGQDYSIRIKEAQLPVNYVYHAVPKIDNDAFLTAEITDWTQLNLLSGKSSIYYLGTFTGESDIDVNNASDTLSISLGRDKNIVIKREGNKEMFDKRSIGNNIKETIGWDITVKNNKSSKIKITIEDQFPLSERKSVEVEQLASSNAKVDEKTGKLTWDLELQPNEKKVLNFEYSVKYPKYSTLSLE